MLLHAISKVATVSEVAEWLRSPGDPVEAGEPLLRVMSDKATVDVHAPAEGVLLRIDAQPKAQVPVGAILGSAASGYFLIFVFGIERSLQLLTVLNIGLGVLVMLSTVNIKLLNRGVLALTATAMALLIIKPDALQMWDAKFFAIFQNNQPEAYDTPEKKQDALENTDVLFYREGVDATISSIKIKGGEQALLVPLRA